VNVTLILSYWAHMTVNRNSNNLSIPHMNTSQHAALSSLCPTCAWLLTATTLQLDSYSDSCHGSPAAVVLLCTPCLPICVLTFAHDRVCLQVSGKKARETDSRRSEQSDRHWNPPHLLFKFHNPWKIYCDAIQSTWSLEDFIFRVWNRTRETNFCIADSAWEILFDFLCVDFLRLYKVGKRDI